MNLEEYFALGDEHAITSIEAVTLNKSLAGLSCESIPNHVRGRLANYLEAALVMGSVDQEIVTKLEVLLSDLENTA